MTDASANEERIRRRPGMLLDVEAVRDARRLARDAVGPPRSPRIAPLVDVAALALALRGRAPTS